MLLVPDCHTVVPPLPVSTRLQSLCRTRSSSEAAAYSGTHQYTSELLIGGVATTEQQAQVPQVTVTPSYVEYMNKPLESAQACSELISPLCTAS